MTKRAAHLNESESLYLKGEWAEKFAVLTKVWSLSEKYQELCSSQFLVRCSVERLLKATYDDTDDFNTPKLQIGRVIYNMECINCTLDWLESQKDSFELIISCRTCSFRNFAVAIVQPRFKGLSDERYYSLREVSSN